MTGRPLFELNGIAKSFPGVKALDGVSFDLRAGEVHALLGENGAGKSTLVKVMSGVYQPDRGTMAIDGQAVTFADPTVSQAHGISPVHQELHLQPWLTVAENIFLGRQPVNRFGLVDRRRMNRDAADLLSRLGVMLDPTATLDGLSIAQRQIIVIARALADTARIVIFDEPTSSLTEHETNLLFATIERLRQQGLGIIYISHRLEEIFRLCDRVTVLRDGRQVGTRAVGDVGIRDLIAMMIGREVAPPLVKAFSAAGEPVLEVRSVTCRGVLNEVSLQVRAGEIVGLSGLVGAGRTELARAIFGDLPLDAGAILVGGKALPPSHGPRQAIAAGIGLVPEDRKEQGLVQGLSVRQNISMPVLGRLTRFGFLSGRTEAKIADDFIRRLAIKTPSALQTARNLSGGNQQRVVIAKWLATRPKVLIVDEPTRGVDVGASAEIHGILRTLASEGVGILMISSDLPEILAVSHRVLVMHQGRITGEVVGDAIQQDAIMHLATGQGLAAGQGANGGSIRGAERTRAT